MKKILVVNDAVFMRTLVKDVLMENGFTDVDEAKDGTEAVEKYREAYKKKIYDLVIMDLTLPNVDGLEALRIIRSFDPNANVVVCSAFGQETVVVAALNSGAKDFIIKPFRPDRIMRAVYDALGC